MSFLSLEESIIGGVYEVAIGTTDADPLIQYWTQFGYCVGETGELAANDAFKLYGVESKLNSIRLYHQDVDHGLIRLFVWDKPTNDGLQLSNMKVIGNRWGTMLTTDICHLQNHAEEAIEQKLPIYLVPPIRSEIYKLKTRPVPFVENCPAVREMCLIQPLTRQVFFQRFGYALPLYGKVNQSAFFKTSQITHFGMLIYDDVEHLRFYDSVLGLLRGVDQKPGTSTYEDPSARAMLSLEISENYASTDFDDPRSSIDPQKARSGRLKIIRFPPETKLENKISHANPGSLGYSLYTLRVNAIEKYHLKLKQSKATNITDICKNEFNELSFSFIAPDGYFWTILQQDLNKTVH